MSITRPGRSVIVLGPSGSGKSTLMVAAAKSFGGGVIITAPGTDEMESYHELYDDATSPVWSDDGKEVTWDMDAPYVIAPFDDADFAPSLGKPGLVADAHRRLIGFLRVVRRVQMDSPGRYPCIIQDTWNGMSDLCVNDMLASMRRIDPPAAMSPDGSTYFGGLQSRNADIARNTRALKGLGMHWLATSHIRKIEASEGARGAAGTTAKEQLMPLIVGGFRDKLTPMFDLVLHSYINKKDEYRVLWKADMMRGAKSRYGKLADTPDLPADWDTIWSSIEGA